MGYAEAGLSNLVSGQAVDVASRRREETFELIILVRLGRCQAGHICRESDVDLPPRLQAPEGKGNPELQVFKRGGVWKGQNLPPSSRGKNQRAVKSMDGRPFLLLRGHGGRFDPPPFQLRSLCWVQPLRLDGADAHFCASMAKLLQKIVNFLYQWPNPVRQQVPRREHRLHCDFSLSRLLRQPAAFGGEPVQLFRGRLPSKLLGHQNGQGNHHRCRPQGCPTQATPGMDFPRSAQRTGATFE